MEARVKRAIDIFLEALKTNTLVKGDCRACAVGNLIADSMGAKITVHNELDHYRKLKIDCTEDNAFWGDIFSTSNGYQDFSAGLCSAGLFTGMVFGTEFSLDELMKIEFAFETNTEINASDYPDNDYGVILLDQINGLEAVIKVMLGFSNDTKTNIREVFTNKINK